MSRFVSLYPHAWRARYEAEFHELIAERAPSLVERFDIVRGALDAHLHPQVRRPGNALSLAPLPEEDYRVVRRLGFAAVIGGLLWPIAFGIASIGPVVYDGQGAYRDGSAAMPFFFLAIVLLVAGLLGHQIRLPEDARLARGSALLAIPFLLMFGVGPWMWQFGLVAIGLLVVLAITGLRSGAWQLGASLAVIVACLGVVGIVAVAVAVASGDRMAGGAFFAAAGLTLVPVWLSVGATLIRRPALPVA
jgi:hypothetical protein